jgi:hypothetical protein
MRLVQILCAAAALTIVAHRADAQPPVTEPSAIGVAWRAPVGHFQPRAGDIPVGTSLSPSREDRELDEKLIICRGC